MSDILWTKTIYEHIYVYHLLQVLQFVCPARSLAELAYLMGYSVPHVQVQANIQSPSVYACQCSQSLQLNDVVNTFPREYLVATPLPHTYLLTPHPLTTPHFSLLRVLYPQGRTSL